MSIFEQLNELKDTKSSSPNKNHLLILSQGVEIWNKWRKENPYIVPNLCYADLIDLNLDNINFKKTLLKHADLAGSNLREAQLYGANLTRSNLFNANLSFSSLESCKFSMSSLHSTNLYKAQIIYAKFIGSSLMQAKLQEANLQNTVFFMCHLIGANFKESNLTGACLEKCNIDHDTNWENVQCDYIYFKYKGKYRDRRPHYGNFKPGDLEKLFYISLNTIDIIFREGIVWSAFLETFNKLQEKIKSNEVNINSFERGSDNALIIRIEVPPDVNKYEMEKYIRHEYQKLLELKDDRIAFYSRQLETERRQSETAHQENLKLLNIIEVMAAKESQPKYNNTFNYPQIGNLSNEVQFGGKQQNIQHNYADRQDIADFAAEIQDLIDQLQKNGSSETVACRDVANDLAQQAKQDPKFLERLKNFWKFIIENVGKAGITTSTAEAVKLALNICGFPTP